MVNGHSQDVPEAISVAALLTHLGVEPGRVAVEHNGHVLKRAELDITRVTVDDRFELVQFVGGGSFR